MQLWPSRRSRVRASYLYSYGLYSYGLYTYGLHTYGLYSYGLCSYGRVDGLERVRRASLENAQALVDLRLRHVQWREEAKHLAGAGREDEEVEVAAGPADGGRGPRRLFLVRARNN